MRYLCLSLVSPCSAIRSASVGSFLFLFAWRNSMSASSARLLAVAILSSWWVSKWFAFCIFCFFNFERTAPSPYPYAVRKVSNTVSVTDSVSKITTERASYLSLNSPRVRRQAPSLSMKGVRMDLHLDNHPRHSSHHATYTCTGIQRRRIPKPHHP